MCITRRDTFWLITDAGRAAFRVFSRKEDTDNEC